MRLNIGCGKRVIHGWVNVDMTDGPGVDVVAGMHDLPFEESSCTDIMAIHVLEHVYPWEAEVAVSEFIRVLVPGGRLALEMPDFYKCCVNVAKEVRHHKHPDMLGLFGLFGDHQTKDPLMMHKWGYTPESLGALLQKHGFSNIRSESTLYHPSGRQNRDMRLVCTKPEM